MAKVSTKRLAETSRPAEARIVAENVCKTVRTSEGRLDILTDINLTIEAGETVAVVGVSGSGKSTLLSLMAGLDLPTTGRVVIDGVSLTDLDEDGRARLRGQKVGFVFQSFQLLPALTALENTMLPLELNGVIDAETQARDYLQKVGLGHRLQHYPRQLSGGEQQRVALARAFVSRPTILFADEPTGNLDRRTGQHVIELLFQLNQDQATTLVLVTHDEALSMRCQRTVLLEGGRIHSQR